MQPIIIQSRVNHACISTFVAVLGICLLFAGCTKFSEVKSPVTSVNAENVFTSNETAISAITAIYYSSVGAFSGVEGLSVQAGLSADEFSVFANVTSTTVLGFYQNKLSAVNNIGTQRWPNMHFRIVSCNTALEGLAKSTALTAAVKTQLTGEALFLRAFHHFYNVLQWGDIPIVLTSDYQQTALLKRSPKSEVFKQIIKDLKEAESLLSTEFLNSSLQAYSGNAERVRASKWAATALLARAYLYTGDYANAEAAASTIIASSNFSLSTTGNAFLRAGLGNNEAILQFQPVIVGWNTEDARAFILNTPPDNTKPIKASQSLLNAFEPGDLRRTSWLRDTTINGSPASYITKYKSATSGDPVNEYLMVLRLPELYLIRAEARAWQNNIAGAISDLNVLRARARATATLAVPNPLPALTTSLTQDQVLDRVAQERRIELFSEWGHRWFDLIRTGKIDATMNAIASSKGTQWESYQQLYPIPVLDLQRNINLVQNPGY